MLVGTKDHASLILLKSVVRKSVRCNSNNCPQSVQAYSEIILHRGPRELVDSIL